MTIRIVPQHAEERPGDEYRRIVRTDDPRKAEVQSEDGVFCPICGRLQPWDKVAIAGVSWCVFCRQVYQCERVVTVTYVTRGTHPLYPENQR